MIWETGSSTVPTIAADFFANHPFHIRTEEFSRRILAPSRDGTFQESKWFYERARGQYADARSLLTVAKRRKFDKEYPRRQRFTKTDLAKFLNVWLEKPHIVSMGAQKNFADFARGIGSAWKKDVNRFSETWYRELVAKAIIFRATERIVSRQPWYQGGYRANIVAYAIAKLAYDVAEMKRSVDFEAIWRRQSPGTAIEDALAYVSREVHEVLVHPPEGISNVTEWAKKQACWERVRRLPTRWALTFVNELISEEERRSERLAGRRDQKLLNGIEAQTAVVQAGPAFWKVVLAWGRGRRLLTTREMSVIGVATRLPNRIPTEAQSKLAMRALKKLEAEGFQERPHI